MLMRYFDGLKPKIVEECLRKYEEEYVPYFPMVVKRMKFIGSFGDRDIILENFIKTYNETVSEQIKDILRGIGYYNRETAGQSVSMQLLKEQGRLNGVSVAVDKIKMQDCRFSVCAVDALIKSTEGVSINENQFRCKCKRKLCRCISVKFSKHPAGTKCIYSTFDHEMGHRLDDAYNLRSIPEIRQLFDKRTGLQMTKQLCSYAWDNDQTKKAIDKIAKKHRCTVPLHTVSAKVGNSAYIEFIAEAWCEYRQAILKGTMPRALASKVVSYIKAKVQKRENSTLWL